MKVGDQVRFLSEVGGGRVARFQGKDIVLVEDEDGFEVPMRVSEVVVVGDEDYDTGRVVKSRQQQKPPQAPSPVPKTVKPSLPKVEERKGGEQLSAYLAFVPIDIHELTETRFEAFFVNDSNYYVRYVLMTAESGSWHIWATGEAEPNTKDFLVEFGRDELGGMERITVQMIAYKKEKSFLIKPVVDVQLRIDPVKFYKLHTFRENPFFEQQALIYTVVEKDRAARSIVADADRLRQEMMSPEVSTAQPQRPRNVSERKDGPLVVDLHASELLETTAGMSPADILNYQLDVFRKTLLEHASRKGMHIVFIHGKGEGVLRRALINELKYRFKNYTYQDASFQEYGYGATQVTIK